MKHPDLRSFVLDPRKEHMESNICVYAFLNKSGRMRSTGIASKINTEVHKTYLISELTSVPFGYLMTIGSDLPDKRLIDISFFAKYNINDWKEFWFRFPVLPIYSFIPADYRPKDQVLKEARENIDSH